MSGLSKKKGTSKKRGLLTAAEGAAKKGYSAAGHLGDVEIAMEQIQNKFMLVLCSIIFFCLLLSVIYQIINIIKISITGVSICDTFDICFGSKPDRNNKKSGYFMNIEKDETDGTKTELNDQHGNFIILSTFIILTIAVILILSATYSSHRINEVAKYDSAYRAVKGAQLVGNIYSQVKKK